MPKSTFLSKSSFLYAAINPKSGSSGAWGTLSEVKIVGLEPSIWPVMLASLVIVGVVAVDRRLGGEVDNGDEG